MLHCKLIVNYCVTTVRVKGYGIRFIIPFGSKFSR